ncbi:MAG: UDP-2,3-diacylglucosamine diphosphatase LpxI [Puniceicoccales bacterium]|jgi:DUF1009 family protein|nr:UDP-2,3-diacylglucosamine diphosphatase LpxI [Puniceicoccales bacterium]
MALSAFLPYDFSERKRIAMIAGRGLYPLLLSDRMQKCGLDVCLVALSGEASEELVAKFSDRKVSKMSIGRIGKLLSFIENNSIDYVMMAGQIQPKKLFHGLAPDFKALSLLSKLKAKNAETIFSAIASEIENVGAKILDARCFMDEDLAMVGNMTKKKLEIKKEYFDHGIKIAKGISELDIGQSVIMRKGTTLAVEDFAGTNDLIERASKFKVDGAFLVKAGKCKQDYRFDLPVFGQRTLDLMVNHGIFTAILEANSVIILDKKNVLSSADKYNVTICGF